MSRSCAFCCSAGARSLRVKVCRQWKRGSKGARVVGSGALRRRRGTSVEKESAFPELRPSKAAQEGCGAFQKAGADKALRKLGVVHMPRRWQDRCQAHGSCGRRNCSVASVQVVWAAQSMRVEGQTNTTGARVVCWGLRRRRRHTSVEKESAFSEINTAAAVHKAVGAAESLTPEGSRRKAQARWSVLRRGKQGRKLNEFSFSSSMRHSTAVMQARALQKVWAKNRTVCTGLIYSPKQRRRRFALGFSTRLLFEAGFFGSAF